MKLKKQEILDFVIPYLDKHGVEYTARQEIKGDILTDERGYYLYEEGTRNYLRKPSTYIYDTQRLAFFSKSRGVYTGVSEVSHKDERYPDNNTIEWYGFYIDLVNNIIRLDSASGNVLVRNEHNLKKVFPSSDALLGMDDHSANMFGFFAKMFEVRKNTNERPNAGRGILRAMEYPGIEAFYKELLIDDSGRIRPDYSLIGEGNYHRLAPRAYVVFMCLWNMAHRRKLMLGEKMSGNLRKDAGISKSVWKELRTLPAKIANNGLREGDWNSDPRWFLENIVSIRGAFRKYGEMYHIYEWEDQLNELLQSPRWFRGLQDTLNNAGMSFNLQRTVEYLLVEAYSRQGVKDVNNASRILHDYYQMAVEIPGFIKYPKYLKVAHDIAVRNFNEYKRTDREEEVVAKTEKFVDMEGMFRIQGNDYAILLLRSAKEIVSEGQRQANCVGGYVERVADGRSVIFSMRKANHPEKTWITLEINPKQGENGRLVQAYQTFNRSVEAEQAQLISAWAQQVGIEIGDRVTGFSHVDDEDLNVRVASRKDDSVNDYHDTPKSELDSLLEKYKVDKERMSQAIASMNTHIGRL